MSEWLKEHDWKSCVCSQRCTGGSNPPLSAIIQNRQRLREIKGLEGLPRHPMNIGRIPLSPPSSLSNWHVTMGLVYIKTNKKSRAVSDPAFSCPFPV